METKKIRFSKQAGLRLLLSTAFLIFAFSVMAQISITGKVTENETGLALPGANIIIKGTTVGTQTDKDGNFTIDVAKGKILVISYIGFLDEEVTIVDEANIQVSLKEDISNLDEIVIVGYGSQKKSVVTGAISRVKAEDIEKLPLLRVEDALQGRASGVVVAANSGQPGSSATVRVRGLTSLNDGANEPLWVVDGVVVDNGGIGNLNQADIESTEVL